MLFFLNILSKINENEKTKIMLNLIHVSKSFDVGGVGKLKVLKDINLSVKKGEFVCVLGPSGCGKTILLYLIAGFLKPTSGKILIEGKPAGNPNTERVMVFQDYVLFPWKTVYGNILFGLNKVNLNNRQKKELAIKYLELVGLTEFKDWYVHKLSGGMQQRVAIARALAVNPKALLMDEPFSALDSSYKRHLRHSLEEIWKKTKKTIILVTHDINEAIHLADKIYLMTASPATFKKVYKINLPRPRSSSHKYFIELNKKIKSDMNDEFKKSMKNQLTERSLDNLLKIKL